MQKENGTTQMDTAVSDHGRRMDGAALRALREERGWTAGHLSERANVSKSYISRLEGDHAKSPSFEILQKLADALGLSVEQLSVRLGLTTQRPLGKSDIDAIAGDVARLKEYLPIEVPLVSTPAAAASGGRTLHAEQETIRYIPLPHQRHHHFIAVAVTGECLAPAGIQPGQIAVVNKDLRPRHGNIVLVRHGDSYLIKGLVRRSDGTLWLEAHAAWEPVQLTEDYVVEGVCVAFQMDAPAYTSASRE